MTATLPSRRSDDRAAPCDTRGFTESVFKLQSDLLPQLGPVVQVLRAAGFDAASIRDHHAGVCLSAGRPDGSLSAKLRFEYENQTFFTPAAQPVFWIFTIHRGNKFLDGLSGRIAFPALPNETDPVIERFFAAVKGAMLR